MLCSAELQHRHSIVVGAAGGPVVGGATTKGCATLCGTGSPAFINACLVC